MVKKSKSADEKILRIKKRIVLDFPPQVVQTPLTYILAKEYDVASNILRAEIAPEESGKLVMEMDGLPDMVEKALERIKEMGINVTEIARKVTFNMDKCIHCGLVFQCVWQEH